MKETELWNGGLLEDRLAWRMIEERRKEVRALERVQTRLATKIIFC